MVTVWRGVKQPRPSSCGAAVSSCVAFRVLTLEMDVSNEDGLNLYTDLFLSKSLLKSVDFER